MKVQENHTILEFKGISKSFFGVKALVNVSFDLRKGEVHALLGENGAGKSTLLNILNGVFPQDAGEIIYNSERVNIRTPFHAKQLGINLVHQELQLVPQLTVAQNIFLGRELTALPKVIDWEKMFESADELLARLDVDFDSREIVKNLSVAQRQMVEIAKAIRQESQVLALDEPTSSLTNKEIEKLFEIIAQLKQAGTTVIYVSHRLEEVFSIADRATVLKDGHYVGTYDVGTLDKQRLITLMVGRSIDALTRRRRTKVDTEPVLEVRNLRISKQDQVNSFCLRRGEVLGIAGLVGSGRSEIARAIFGADKKVSGEILINGKLVSIDSPEDAVRHGIALIPEDRKLEGFVPLLSNEANINLSSLKNFNCFGVQKSKPLQENALNFMKLLNVSPLNPKTMTRNLSGGNQQKVVLAKWLSTKANIVIFDEPTRGIDVGAKSEIYRLINDLAKREYSIIIISSELVEIIGLCDRVLVMYEGVINGELEGDDITEENILYLAMGGK
jgi:ABC-type sugar transport system ATPase subunit